MTPMTNQCLSENGCEQALPPRLFPFSRFRRAEDRVDHGHIGDSRFEWNGHVSVALHGAGELIALQCVLIDDGRLMRLDTAAEKVTAVVKEDAARPVGRGVERDFDFDAPFCAKKLHTLIGNELRGTSEDRMAGGEIENRRSDAIDLHFGVAIYQAHDAVGFGTEEKA